jgi:DNA-binding CsgD family transcriptional regulator
MTATADDVFGRSPEGDMWDADGDRVLLLNDEGWQYIENMPDLSIDEDADLRDIAQLQSVTLTDAEWSVIDAVADHGSSYGYAKRVGERLGMNSGSVRMHLSNVRQKVLTNATN